MARKTNYTNNHGNDYYRVRAKVGLKKNEYGIWVDDIRSFYGKSKSEAIAKRDLFLGKYKGNDGAGMECLGVLMDRWIETVFIQSSMANSTKVKYVAAYERVFMNTHTAGKMIIDVTAFDIQNVYNGCGENPGTIRACHNLIRQFYKYAELNNIAKDITGSLVAPKTKKTVIAEEIDAWDDDDLKRVIDALEGTTMKFLVVLAVNSGVRFAELLALKYSDIRNGMVYVNKQLSEIADIKKDGQNSTELHITQTKTVNSNRAVPLSKAVLDEFKKHKELHQKEMKEKGYETDYIFTTSNGTFYYKRNINRSLTRLYARIGVPYHKFHSYRHTFGTNLSRAGVPIEETASLMGHTDISITARYYININSERRRAAVERISAFSLNN